MKRSHWIQLLRLLFVLFLLPLFIFLFEFFQDPSRHEQDTCPCQMVDGSSFWKTKTRHTVDSFQIACFTIRLLGPRFHYRLRNMPTITQDRYVNSWSESSYRLWKRRWWTGLIEHRLGDRNKMSCHTRTTWASDQLDPALLRGKVGLFGKMYSPSSLVPMLPWQSSSWCLRKMYSPLLSLLFPCSQFAPELWKHTIAIAIA